MLDLSVFNDAFLWPFGEKVVYRPRVGAMRAICADVDRSPPADLFGDDRIHTDSFVAWVKNDGKCGISAKSVDAGVDKIDVARHPGGPLVTRTIMQVLDEDGGMIRIEIR